MTEVVHKGNLKSKIIRLSKKLGESSALDKTAEMTDEEKEALKQQLDEARRGKLSTKMFQATKALKSNLKKSKALEIQKQVRKVKDACTARENAKPADAMEVDKDEKEEQEVAAEKEKKKKKAITAEDVARYEKELEILKQVNVDTLAEKTLRNKVLKHSELKHHAIVTDTLPAAPESNTNTADRSLDEKTMISTIESRILGHKSAQVTISKLLQEILNVIRPPPKAQPATSDNNNKNKKRDPQDYRSKRDAKRLKGEDPALTAASTFVESLNADEVLNRKKRGDDDEYDDPDFDDIYNGDQKKNRPGQRQRRQQYEKQYGRNANHLKRSRDETRLVKRKDNVRRDTPAAAASAGARGGDSQKNSGLLKPEEFHPSWQAKRQEQEMIAKALSGGGASNKKIVFDDSD